MKENKKKKSVVLAIFDGLGIASASVTNAFKNAHTPHLDQLFADNFTIQLAASSENVGLLPHTMGNSEVGHITIGAGRIVEQPLTRITNAIKSGSFLRNSVLQKFLGNVTDGNKRLHIMGLCSRGRVHADIEHLYALCDIVAKLPIQIFLHLFLDGRDTKKDSALATISELEILLRKKNYVNIHIATLSGRYYSMDRDMRLERTQLTVAAMTRLASSQTSFKTASAYIAEQYHNGVYDEFIKPTFSHKSNVKSEIMTGDSVICFNFRPDRAVQICQLLLDPNYINDVDYGISNIKMLTFVFYGAAIKAEILYPRRKLINTIGEVVANAGLSQLRIAETEKIAHITYFLDGGTAKQLKNSDKILIPSDRSVATYDLKPQMRAAEITKQVIKNISKYDLIIFNFANADMVGHTGNMVATQIAIEFLDVQIGKIYEATSAARGVLVITADHGNAEQMLFKNHEICKTHTTNNVPLCIADANHWIPTSSNNFREPSLQDVASTILYLLHTEIPHEMTGDVLIKQNPKVKKIGILTSGGDAPGMNACIRAITKYSLNQGIEVAFIKDGFKGLATNNIQNNICHNDVLNIIGRGGTIIGSSRFPQFREQKVVDKAAENLQKNNIDALVVIGGNGSFYGAQRLDAKGVKCIGIPGTIDNDIRGTDRSIGFDTCLNTIVKCVDNINDTAQSHKRCMIVEIMGRNCGDLAARAGLACGANVVLMPEKKWKLDYVLDFVKRSQLAGKSAPLILVTEMQTDVFHLAETIQQFTTVETRATQLGFVQRGGSPSFFDRYLAALMGTESVKLLKKGISSVYLGYVRGKIVTINIQNGIQKNPRKILKIESLNNKINEL